MAVRMARPGYLGVFSGAMPMTREEVEAKIAAGESLSGADFREADLSGANLYEANNLEGATGVNLGQVVD